MTKKTDLTRRELLKIVGAGSGAALSLAGLPGTGHAKGAPASLPQVPRRVLGKTKKTVPILLFGGAMKLDPRFDPKLAEALRFGVDYFDAADCYGGGTCEGAVGHFHTRAKIRDKIWITSKSDEHEPEGFEATLKTSLKKLKTNYVDMYYLHALKDPSSLNNKLLKLVERLKKEGKMKFFGFSCHHGNVVSLLHKAAALPWVDSVMFRYNFRQYGNKELHKAIDAAHKAGVGLIAMKTQGSEASFRSAWKKFQKKGKWNKHQAVLKAVWADERISAAVSHMDTFEKLKQNIAAAIDKSKLSAREQQELKRYAEATRAWACDGCDHFCHAAVDAPVEIGATMRYLMYHDVYGDVEGARTLFHALPSTAKNLSDVDFGPATQACPHGIDVGAHMTRAAQVLVA